MLAICYKGKSEVHLCQQRSGYLSFITQKGSSKNRLTFWIRLHFTCDFVLLLLQSNKQILFTDVLICYDCIALGVDT